MASSAGGDGGRKPPETSGATGTRRLRQPAIAEQSRFMSTRANPPSGLAQTASKRKPRAHPGLSRSRVKPSRDQGALAAPRYYSKAQIRQGADRDVKNSERTDLCPKIAR